MLRLFLFLLGSGWGWIICCIYYIYLLYVGSQDCEFNCGITRYSDPKHAPLGSVWEFKRGDENFEKKRRIILLNGSFFFHNTKSPWYRVNSKYVQGGKLSCNMDKKYLVGHVYVPVSGRVLINRVWLKVRLVCHALLVSCSWGWANLGCMWWWPQAQLWGRF